MKVIRNSERELQKLYNRMTRRRKIVEERVRRILEDVRSDGDDAVIRYTKRFDHVRLTPARMRVSESELNGAYQAIDTGFVSTLKQAIENVTQFYRRQMKKSWRWHAEDGVVVGEKRSPLERVGVYIPAGTAPLISTVYMTVLPAQVAGVKRIVLVTPPNASGHIDPHILVVANLLKVNEVYKVGGAQAIGALAFGTRTIPRVDKIVGPGNAYVTEAKRQVFGYVDIDMVAGPSELAIIANQLDNHEFVAADLRAEGEHAGGLSILITPSKALARKMKDEPIPGYILLAKNLEHAVEITNRLAPEHLEIMVKNPQRILKKVQHAGAIFLGPYSPASVGDYVAGPSHVLPTGGTARFFSGLAVEDFMKRSHVISYSRKALERMRGAIEKLAELEGLPRHAECVRIRFGETKESAKG